MNGIIGVEEVLEIYERLGYKIDNTEFFPNFFGIRNTKKYKDLFPHDTIGCIYNDGSSSVMILSTGYTDLSQFVSRSILKGTGVISLMPGFYQEVYRIGYHKVKHELLRQVAPMNYCNTLDNGNIIGFTDNQFSNMHRGSYHLISNNISRYNNGGQIITDNMAYNKFMNIIKIAADSSDKAFSYSLFLDSDIAIKSI